MYRDHAIGDALRFEPGNGGLTRAVIHSDACAGELYLHGSHVTAWQPRDQQPVLFTSTQAVFADGKPIRGGVPICFPWFGPHPAEPDAPMHGVVRTKTWDLRRTTQQGGDITLELETHAGDLHAIFAVTFGSTLTMTLTAVNRGAKVQQISDALHTYLAVGDVRNVHVTGLKGLTYQSKVHNNERFTEDAAELRLTGRTDRVYLNNPGSCVVHDPDLKRRIVVAKQGSNSTVVWNISAEAVNTLSDMAADEWPRYLCIEAANALDNAYTLEPGQTHSLTQTLTVEPL